MLKKNICLWLMCGWIISAMAADPLTVLVAPDCGVVNGGQFRVQSIFNVNANGSSRGAADDLIKNLNFNGGRAFFWIYAGWRKDVPMPPHTPWSSSQYGGKAVDRQELVKLQDQWYNRDFRADMNSVLSKYRDTDEMFQQLKYFKRWGVTKDLLFHTQVDGSAIRYPERVNEYYSAYIDTIRKYAPELEVKFIQLTNEPNYPWWSGEFQDDRTSVDVWIKVFNRLDEFIAKKYPEVNLLGPCLASSSFFSWGGWRTWTVPVLRGVDKPMKYFNYHLYDIGAYSHLAWMEMLQAQAESMKKVRPQAYVSEFSYELNAVSPEKRFQWLSEQLFMALNNPDKFFALSYHLLMCPQYFDNSNVISYMNKEVKPGSIYWVYWALNRHRGENLYMTLPASLPVIGAAARDGSKLIASFYNRSDSPVTFDLDPGLKVPVIAATLQLAYCQDGKTMHRQESAGTSLPVKMQLPPHAIGSVEFTVAEPVVAARQLLQQEFFSDSVAKYFKSALDCRIVSGRLPKENETAVLRVGLFSDDIMAAQKLNAEFNGHRFPLLLNTAVPEVSLEYRNTWWFEIPLQSGWVKDANLLRLTDADTAYKLMFASIVFREHPTRELAEKNGRQSTEYFFNRIYAACNNIGQCQADSEQTVKFSVTNSGSVTRSYRFDCIFPESLLHKVGDFPTMLTLKSGETGVMMYKFITQHVSDLSSFSINWNISSDGLPDETVVSRGAVYPCLKIKSVTVALPVDGSPDGWKNVPVSTDVRNKDIRVVTRLAWDRENFYASFDVSGVTPPRPAASIGSFWLADSVEFFIDPENRKSRNLDDNCRQLFVAPAGWDGNPGCLSGRIIFRRQGDFVNPVDTVREKRIASAIRQNDKGYNIACAIPWEIMGVVPVAHRFFGINITVNVTGDNGVKCGMQVGGVKDKNHNAPQKWSSVILD